MEYKVKVSDDKRDEIGKIMMLDVLDANDEIIGKQAGIVLAPYIADDIKNNPDLSEKLQQITDSIHMVMVELINRSNNDTKN